jgi:hypothetical protein
MKEEVIENAKCRIENAFSHRDSTNEGGSVKREGGNN